MKLLQDPVKLSQKRSKSKTWGVSKGKCRGGGQSSKAKGRAAVQQVRNLLIRVLGLGEDDVFVKATSQIGCDLHLSPYAHQYFPYAIEVKNTEKLNIFKALAQAANNTEGDTPIVFFKRARTPLFVAIDAEHFVKLLSQE